MPILDHHRGTLTTAALLAAFLSTPVFPAKKPKPLKAADVYKRTAPAVVAIDCLGADQKKIAAATGFLVSDTGRIVTNLHVILPCASLSVRLTNGDAYDSTYMIEADARRDLALIRIKAASLPFLTLGDSDTLEVGQAVFSIGNPRGLQNTLQQGLVSGFRQMDGYRLVQVSASINPGNSGGPILDEQGQVVAVASAKIKDAENLGFAIPINYVKGVLDSKNEVAFNLFALALKRIVTADAQKKQTAPPGGVVGGVVGGVPGGVAGGVGGGMVAAPHPAPPPPVRTPQEPTDQIRVGGKVQAANLIKKVTPPYPPLAKQARIQGTVRFSATIGKDGTVTSLQLISGHPLLAPAAQEAVKQWIYKPTLMNGQPVQVLTQIDVNFNLEAQSTVTDLPEGVSIAPPTGPDWDPLPAFTGPFVVSLRSEIGVWDLDSAKSGLGESGMKGPFQAGAAYTYYEFASPNSPNFASAGLRFRNSNGKLLNAILAPRHRVRWERQVEVVKEKFPNEELRSIQHGANTKYISVGGRTSFEVGPDGYVLYMLIY